MYTPIATLYTRSVKAFRTKNAKSINSLVMSITEVEPTYRVHY
jgi:hypothetical protein